jgi:hypothetical protein
MDSFDIDGLDLTPGSFYDQETDDYLLPLAHVANLPAASPDYREYARVLKALNSGSPLAETGRQAVAK